MCHLFLCGGQAPPSYHCQHDGPPRPVKQGSRYRTGGLTAPVVLPHERGTGDWRPLLSVRAHFSPQLVDPRRGRDRVQYCLCIGMCPMSQGLRGGTTENHPCLHKSVQPCHEGHGQPTGHHRHSAQLAPSVQPVGTYPEGAVGVSPRGRHLLACGDPLPPYAGGADHP